MGINFLEVKNEVNDIRLAAYDKISDLIESPATNDPTFFARQVVLIVGIAEKDVQECFERVNK